MGNNNTIERNIRGFSFSAVKCGIRYEGRLDLALIHSDFPCTASGLFTTNKIFAAPVRLCRERITNDIHSILINSTNANACTGDGGYNDAVALTGEIAGTMNKNPESVLMASTGIIGVPLPVNKMIKSIPELTGSLSPDNAESVTRAIMTTDTIPKEYSIKFNCSSGNYSIWGTAKGSGMIAPNMATLLVFILTDASIKKSDLDPIFKRSVDSTFNSLTIDGDMSTNDTAIILSPKLTDPLSGENDLKIFENSLKQVLAYLSELIIKDAEGGTKIVKIDVKGAKNGNDAKLAAKTIAESLLVKTALFGNDPNWGRIACAAGYSGADVREDKISVYFENVLLLDRGTPVEYDKSRLKSILERDSYTISVDLGIGDSTSSYLTSDISIDYVKINSEYST